MKKIAINGYGRIGRDVVRAIYETGRQSSIKVVAINDMASPEIMQHLTRFDSTHGIFAADIGLRDGKLIIDGDTIELLSEKDPAKLAWGDRGIDLVMECSGKFKTRQHIQGHLDAGAPRVLVGLPVADADAMVVHGVNDEVLKSKPLIVSNASCTTNCLAPMAKVLNDSIGIEQGYMTTIHAYTNDQNLIDKVHSDLYRARSATQSMIPTKTGAASAVGKVLPELLGKLDGLAVRVPTLNVSMVDLVFVPGRATSVEEINRLMKAAVDHMPAGVLQYNELPLVSIDFNHNPASCIFDGAHTRVAGELVKVMAWYDNEWGYSNRMIDIALAMTEG